MFLLDKHRYNNLKSECSAYAVGQPLLLGVQLESDDNTSPTYVSIEALFQPTYYIEKLECCRILAGGNTIDVIDLAPFLQAAMSDRLFQKFTIIVENDGETGTSQLENTLFGYRQSLQYGIDPVLAPGPLTTPSTVYAVYAAELLLNDDSPIYLPNEIVKFEFPIYSVLSDTVISSTTRTMQIAPSQTSILVQKSGASGPVTIFERDIIRRNVCGGENSILVKYLNRYGYYEYFMFDNHYTTNMELEMADRIYTKPVNNISYRNSTVIPSFSTEKVITATVAISDEDYYNKFVDLAMSTNVLLFDGDDVLEDTNWVEVDKECNVTYNSTRKVGRQVMNLIVRNNFVY